ncbi:MAG: hypothetical protein WC460_03960 [Patescibacteria group bacterium]
MCAQTQKQESENKNNAETARALQLRKRQLIAMRQNQTQENAESPVSKVGAKFTAQALKFSWLNLIDSFGLTLIYINFHFLGKYIAGSNLFSDFGEEWLPKTASEAMPGKGGGAPKWFEIIALFLLDFILIILVLFALIIIFTPALIVVGIIS